MSLLSLLISAPGLAQSPTPVPLRFKDVTGHSVNMVTTEMFNDTSEKDMVAADFNGDGLIDIFVVRKELGYDPSNPASKNKMPIVLLNDRQTIGGYPKIGAALSLDTALLAQSMPGTRVQFMEIDPADAHNALHLAHSRYQRHLPKELA